MSQSIKAKGMLFMLILAPFLYMLVKLLFLLPDDTVPVLDCSHFNSIFDVAKRLEKLHQGCKVHVGLQLPDYDSASLKDVDLVLVANQEAVLISVNNRISGSISIDKDNNWETENSRKPQPLLDPVAETKTLVSILEEYLEQRGVTLPQECLSFKVICPSPSFLQWQKLLMPEQINLYSKFGLLEGKKKMPESLCEMLNRVLSTAPISDRLELKNNTCILGEFIEFRGGQDDLRSLRKIKRSKVSRVSVRTPSFFAVDDSTVHVRISPRDYREEGPSRSKSSQQDEYTIKACTVVVFHPQNSESRFMHELSSVGSIVLSA